tara:strand:- start:186 stop:614 length:429 start_codon:yes stop_codon:yes gene_type:complete
MKRIFSLILFVMVSNNAIASLEGEALICDNDKRGYNFVSKDQVKVSAINLNELNKLSIKHSYELADNAIFIHQPVTELNKEKKTRPIGWIFRRTLDYVSLDYVDGDWSRRFLWSCEVTSSNQLEIRLKNKIDKLTKANEKKF